eukprot:CAMPEP_0185731340 /NCGR_PEP_ID=MMETSP1171-20130828/12641_1 /TAXON_ID=374046 /ORGANISM="Helicotheca tamensis, Strain CCMP826" /LENGTH=255 /DNA_ID=CAMNT_0028400589 /DNA_START=91 /DNA_END=858 /DNA_ORIENTATION=+
MRWTIDVPTAQAKEKDLREVMVIPDNDLPNFLQEYQLDTSFPPTKTTLPKNTNGMSSSSNPSEYNASIVHAALDKGTNLATYNKDNGQVITLYRVQEKKKAGRHYVGVGTGVIVYHETNPSQIVLTLRSGTTNNRHGEWELPGGTVEIGDTLEETVIKECKEEVCLDVEPVSCVDVCEDFPRGKVGEEEQQQWICFGYAAKIIGGELGNGEPHKFAQVKMFDIDNLPENTSVPTKIIVDQFLKGNGIKISSCREG